MSSNITTKDKIRLILYMPKYWLYDYPKLILHYANMLKHADWDTLLTTLDMNKSPEDAVSYEMHSKDHIKLRIKGKDVVDLGAYYADTAIYYAKRGAKHVYAYEARQQLVNKGKLFIKKNRLESKISLYCKFVDADSLAKIVKTHKLRNAAMKIDIEGGERDIICKATDDTLRHFSQIHVECHYGYLDIEKRLQKAGFKTEHTAPIYTYKGLKRPAMIRCDLYATI